MMHDGRDRELLAEALGEAYEIEIANGERPLAGEYDAAVLDLGGLERVEDRLAEAKAADGAFLPFVLLLEERDVGSLAPGRRAAVDDVIAMPASREGLRARVENLVARRRTSLELRRQNERLETFASVVSHDLRNPLSVAEGRLELAMDGGGEEDLEAAQRALARM
ncbi:MAG: PAS domain-containing sensor histidine kinase, partial [Actinobacteria bacterium]|nr:PAS domain-containing sensor histidine kinase [Actinomycetota bacterium]